MHSICIYILIKSKTKDELEKNIERIKQKLFIAGMVSKKTNFRQKELLEVSLPLNNNKNILKEVSSRNILTSSLSGFYPFVSNGIYDKKGIFFGIEKNLNSLIFIDRFDRKKYKNGNMCILGSSGSGKSFFTKLQIIRERLYNKEQYILDPEKEYYSVCKALGGSYIKFGRGTKKYVNILDLNTHKKRSNTKEKLKDLISNKIESLKIFFLSIFESIPKDRYLYFEEKLKQLYYVNQKKENKEIILSDVQQLMKNDKKLEKYSNLLNPFISGSLAFFNNKTNIDLNNKLIVVDLHDLEGENLKYGLFIFLDFFWNKIRQKSNVEKIIYIDEIWKLIGASATKETAEYIYKLFKTIRKFNASAVAITQDISDLFSIDDGKFGSTILNNSAFKTIFSLNDENINKISKYLYLSDNEKILIRGLKKGECFMQVERDKILIEILSGAEEKKILKERKNKYGKEDNNDTFE